MPCGWRDSGQRWEPQMENPQPVDREAGPDIEARPPTDDQSNGEGYRVSLQFFEGPLDLLLHLIRKHEVDIYDIPIATITREYLGYLDLLKRLNLEVAGSFLEMAATLTLIKSRTLLPQPAVEEGEEEVDPRAELVEQLLEYQTAKEAAEHLRQRAEEAARVHYRGGGEGAKGKDRPRILGELTLVDLLDAFQVVLREIEGRGTHEVAVEPLTIKDQVGVILEALEERDLILFTDLFKGSRTIGELVVTFLALLELVRLQAVSFRQEAPFAPIWILRRVAEKDGPMDLSEDPIIPHSNAED